MYYTLRSFSMISGHACCFFIGGFDVRQAADRVGHWPGFPVGCHHVFGGEVCCKFAGFAVGTLDS